MVIGLVFTSCSALISQTQQREKDLLVSTNWLEENLSDSSLVILHYGMKTEYKKGHIPGARLISIWDILVKNEDGLRHELPDKQKLEQVLRSWGINDDSKIIISYQEGNDIPMAARLFYTLDYAGLGDQVSILNGGYKAWQKEERPVTQEMTGIKEGNIAIRIVDEVRISKGEVFASLNDENVKLVDARPHEKYLGTGEDNNSSRPGHIKGAVNIPFFEVTREDSSHIFKSKEELHLLFEDQKLHEGYTIITYCGTGIWASPLYLTAKLLGYNVRFYDGSYQEWGNDESLPIDSLD